MTDLTGRVALVTGGSRGIGAAIALRLARDGADVALTYLTAQERATAVVRDIEALGRRGLAVRADSADSAAVTAAVDHTVERLGRLDILVNNAGVFPFGPFEKVDADELDHTIAVHVRSAFVAAQDERLGALFAKVDALGLRENTVVIFQSDNGHSTEERAHFGGGSAGPYRGAKFSLLEGGIRLPARFARS